MKTLALDTSWRCSVTLRTLESVTGGSFCCHYLWMVLRLCSQVLVTPFLRLSVPLPKFQKSVILSPQRRSRWSQPWPDDSSHPRIHQVLTFYVHKQAIPKSSFPRLELEFPFSFTNEQSLGTDTRLSYALPRPAGAVSPGYPRDW